ncbi:phosphoglycerate kinase [archaeon]|nr:phosphoglycerate kinase [archaeon]
MKTIKDYELASKKVLLRVDFNSPIVEGKIELNDRFMAHVETIKKLVEQKARVTVMAHQGRPGDDDFTSLEQHAELLNKQVKARFIKDVIGDKAVKAIKSLKDGEVLLLDNVRSLKQEFKPSTSNKMVKTLAPLFDLYVNDAFSVSHRSQTSVVSFPKVMPSCAGPVMEREVNAIRKIHEFKEPSVFVLGGEKPEDSKVVIKELGDKVTRILTCGIFGQFCLLSKGFNFGAQNKYITEELGYSKDKELAKLLDDNIKTPVDFGVKAKNERKDLLLSDFPVNYEIFDIGPETIERYCKIIKKASSIFMKGTPGYSEDEKFALGTKKILKTIADSDSFSVIGGGHTRAAIDRFGISEEKFSHLSLSGGALMKFIAGKELPGVEVLK